MTEEEFIKELRRAIYGTYDSYWKLRDALRNFLRQYKDESPLELSTVDKLLNKGLNSGWIFSLIPSKDSVSQWCIAEDSSITIQRDNLFKSGAQPPEAYYKRNLERARTEEIPELKQRLADEIETESAKDERVRLLEEQLAAAKDTIARLSLSVEAGVINILEEQLSTAREQNRILTGISAALNKDTFQPIRTFFGNTIVK